MSFVAGPDPFAALPRMRPACRICVVIPARDEARSIERSLAALDAARPDARREILVLANNCSDETATIARRCAARANVPMHVVSLNFPQAIAHIGTARRVVADCAVARFAAAGARDGIIASTDADSVVASDWVRQTEEEFAHGADAVMGRIRVSAAERSAFDRATNLLYLRDSAYARYAAELEAAIDPIGSDRAPRHGQYFGASLAVSVRAYVRAGGIPAIAQLEDVAFVRRLESIDAAIRHSMHVQVTTSARRRARVEGGLATQLATWTSFAERGEPWLVPSAEEIVTRARAHAALRGLHRRSAASGVFDESAVAARFALTAPEFARIYHPRRPFGANAQRLWSRAMTLGRWRERYALAPLEVALAELRAWRREMRACPQNGRTADVDERAIGVGLA